MMNTYHLIPNIHKTVQRAYDQYGRPVEKPTETTPTYAISASNIFHAWFTTRDRDLKPMTQSDVEDFQKEVKSLSVETACRNYIKQSFERVYNEDGLFLKIFSVEPLWSQDPETVYQKLKAINTTMAHPGNISPLANNLQSTLQTSDLQTICNLVGWLASEYSMPDNDDDESPFQAKSREYAARLLIEHLWPFTDKAFDVEITKSISKAVAQDSDLKIGPVEGGVASSNAFPLVKKAMELLVMFDQSMPKDRSVCAHVVCSGFKPLTAPSHKIARWYSTLCGRQSTSYSELKRASRPSGLTQIPTSSWSRTCLSSRMNWCRLRLVISVVKHLPCSTSLRSGIRLALRTGLASLAI